MVLTLIPTKTFYEEIKKSKYVISPVGAGYDCYRVYESLLLDSIPIIIRNPLSDFYDKIPVFLGRLNKRLFSF